MPKEPPRGTLIEVWVVADPAMSGPMSVLGVFADQAMAADYVANEAPPVPDSFVMAPVRRQALKWDDGDRVSLFDERLFGPYELSTDYTSEPTRREKELRASAIAKLTEEERKVLRL